MRAKTVDILGVPAHVLDFDAVVSAIERLFVDGSKQKYIVALNAEKIMMARRNPEMMQVLRDAYLLIPDGVGVSLASRILYREPVPRVQGYDLFMKMLSIAGVNRQRVFLLGAASDVSKIARDRLMQDYPGTNIVGHHHGYFTDDKVVVDLINRSEADFLFVGMGSPKQEKWIFRNIKKLEVKLCFGVGGSFDVIAGKAKLAPQVIRKRGFEFVYRLLVNPRRLRRQLVFPNFLATLLAARTKLIKSNKR
jgi:N-acetylglucosaminyldiphosphoundecaprenol N-acetyl-beta-D-mannosaminyltransferase